MTNDELLHKWINGIISKEELKLFEQRPEFVELTELYRQTEHLDAPTFDKKIALNTILSTKKSPLRPVKTERRIFFMDFVKYAAVASFLLIAGWFFFNSGSPTTVIALAGEQKEGTLPDGSVYHLNAESSLTFHQKNWAENRILILSGEAFFEVKKGEIFLVQTQNGSVQVLGTKFIVRVRNEYLEVKCTEGKVAVLSKMGRKMSELTANDALRVINNQVINSWTLEKDTDSWLTGISKFRSVKLSEILAELERQFSIKIINNGIDETTILTANFQHQNLELALKTTLGTLEVKYKIDGKRVILSAK